MKKKEPFADIADIAYTFQNKKKSFFALLLCYHPFERAGFMLYLIDGLPPVFC